MKQRLPLVLTVILAVTLSGAGPALGQTADPTLARRPPDDVTDPPPLFTFDQYPPSVNDNVVLQWDEELLQAVQAATSLLKAHRMHGHLAAKLDPLGKVQTSRLTGSEAADGAADAKIIATLEPSTRIKVVSAKGDYLQVQTIFEGKAIRGYVHREDAFFERPRKDKRPSNGSSVLSGVNEHSLSAPVR